MAAPQAYMPRAVNIVQVLPTQWIISCRRPNCIQAVHDGILPWSAGKFAKTGVGCVDKHLVDRVFSLECLSQHGHVETHHVLVNYDGPGRATCSVMIRRDAQQKGKGLQTHVEQKRVCA